MMLRLKSVVLHIRSIAVAINRSKSAADFRLTTSSAVTV
ncbi:MAG: hypothetical protein ACI9PU_002483, partial [Ascidiaceihabitans sp.]